MNILMKSKLVTEDDKYKIAHDNRNIIDLESSDLTEINLDDLEKNQNDSTKDLQVKPFS